MNLARLLLILLAVTAFTLAGCASDPAAPDAGDDDSDGSDGGNDGGSEPVTNEDVDCPSGGNRVTINQAGSSTVLPIAEAWAEEFGRCINANIVVGGGGTGAGFQKFCRGELDISDASRPIRTGPGSETAACQSAGITPFEVQIAIDGLSVVVAESNTFVQCLTVQQLYKIWTNGPQQVDNWNELNSAWPNQKIALFGPGTDSGTYDYFREVIIQPNDGATASTRADYTPSEDDNVLVQGVSSSQYALGYFGLAYYEQNADKLNVVKVDDGKGNGCVEPTGANVESGKYAPLSRPLFMYTNGKPTGTLKAYFEQGLAAEGQNLAREVGYIGLPAAKLAEMKAKIA